MAETDTAKALEVLREFVAEKDVLQRATQAALVDMFAAAVSLMAVARTGRTQDLFSAEDALDAAIAAVCNEVNNG